jgi:hypothetical protein
VNYQTVKATDQSKHLLESPAWSKPLLGQNHCLVKTTAWSKPLPKQIKSHKTGCTHAIKGY